MKKGINAWVFDADYSFEKVFETAKKYGFETIELNVDHIDNPSKHCLTLNTTDATLDEIKALSVKYGVKVSSISSSVYWTARPFGSGDKEGRKEAVGFMEKQLYCAKYLGADTILVVTGIDEKIGYKKSFENTIDCFIECKPMFEKYGINVGVENVWNKFANSPYDYVRIFEAVNSKYLGIYYDLGNMLVISESEYWLEVIAPYIKAVHIKDFKKTDAFYQGGAWCDLFKGDLNYEAVMPMLKKIGYDKQLSAEIFNTTGRDEKEFLSTLSEGVGKAISMAK